MIYLYWYLAAGALVGLGGTEFGIDSLRDIGCRVLIGAVVGLPAIAWMLMVLTGELISGLADHLWQKFVR